MDHSNGEKKIPTEKASPGRLNGQNLKPAAFVTPTAKNQDSRVHGLGLSELSKQLRILQAKNQQQEVEIDRLERQLKIAADLQGISVSDLRAALHAACESEAYGELQNHVASLKAQLEAATLTASRHAKNFEEEAAEKHKANLQLKIGELQEVEERLRKELSGLYDSLKEQTAKATQLESICRQQKEEIEQLKEKEAIVPYEVPPGAPYPESTPPGAAPTQNTNQALVPVQTPTPYATFTPADIACLTGEAREAKTEAQMEREKVKLLEQQLAAREADHKLRDAQFKARFIVQDERIEDLEQQLTSLYTAFELLRQEQSREDEKRASLEENLHNADAQVARDLEAQNNGMYRARSPVAIAQAQSLPNVAQTRHGATSSPPVSPRASSSRKYTVPPPSVAPHSSQQPQAKDLVVAGTLLVRGNDMLRRWKKRYVALYRTFTGYKLTMTDGSRAVVGKSYDLKPGLSCARRNKQFVPKYPFAFVLHVNPHNTSAPVVHAAASTENNLNDWLSELRAALDFETPLAVASFTDQEATDLETALQLSEQER